MKKVVLKNAPIPQYILVKKDKNPIFIWGVGALARNVYNYCINFNINVSGFFVNISDSFNSFFNNIPVYSLEQLIELYPKFSVIIGHSNYAEGIELLEGINNVENIYCLSSLCYSIYDLVDISFIEKNYFALDSFYMELEDEKSKKCLKSYFESRVYDKPEYMFSCFDKGITYFINDVFQLSDEETFLDIGACYGKAIWSFLQAVNYNYSYIMALEPEEENYVLLKKNIENLKVKNIMAKQVCAYNKCGTVHFEGDWEQGGIKTSISESSYKMYPATTIDSLCEELPREKTISIIKINFAFSVSEVLEGGKNLLKERKPKLIIRSGFDENVLLETYMFIKKVNPQYKIYLRYTVGIPQGLTLFAI